MKHKILIVEDEEAMVKALVATFTEEGFEVISAKNGVEGLDVALKNQPEIILLDLMMPVMDGLIMLDKLRENEWGKKVPVVVLTNAQGSEHISDAMKNQVTRYLVKSDKTLSEVVVEVKGILKIH